MLFCCTRPLAFALAQPRGTRRAPGKRDITYLHTGLYGHRILGDARLIFLLVYERGTKHGSLLLYFKKLCQWRL